MSGFALRRHCLLGASFYSAGRQAFACTRKVFKVNSLVLTYIESSILRAPSEEHGYDHGATLVMIFLQYTVRDRDTMTSHPPIYVML